MTEGNEGNSVILTGEARPITDIERFRSERRIQPFLTDYLPDDTDMAYEDRVSYYRMVRSELGIPTIRTEFRLSRILNPDGTWNAETIAAYTDSLRAMQESGLAPPVIAVFTPSKEQYRLAESDPQAFTNLYGSCVEKTLDIARSAGIDIETIQVMNEVNTGWQTKVGQNQIIDLIRKTKDILIASPDFRRTKVMTTLLVGSDPDAHNWQEKTRSLVEQSGAALDAIGFDYYPGTYEDPVVFSTMRNAGLSTSRAFLKYGNTTPYKWIFEQKATGILSGKHVVIAETGAPAVNPDSRMQRLGYDRLIQALDHELLTYEKQGYKGHDLLSAVGFFTGGLHAGVDTKAPFKIDFLPWTLIRKDSSGEWKRTNAASRLKHLITTRLTPAAHNPTP